MKRALLTPALVGQNSAGVTGTWPAILDLDTWEQVGQLLTAPERIAKGTMNDYSNGGARKFALSGLLECAYCHGKLLAGPYSGKPFYACLHPKIDDPQTRPIRIGNEDLEQFIVRLAIGALDSPEVAQEIESRKTEPAEAADLRTQITADRARLQRISDDHDDGVIDRAEWIRRRDRVQGRVDANLLRLDVLHGRSARALATSSAEATKLWKTRDVTWRRTFLTAMIEKVVVNPLPDELRGRHQPEDWEARAALVASRVEVHWRV